MKETREMHGLWKDWNKIPKQVRYPFPPIVGKWHYHYENKNGRIGLIRLNHGLSLKLDENGHWKGHCYEACGVLDFEKFNTKKDAEIAIYNALGEEYKK